MADFPRCAICLDHPLSEGACECTWCGLRWPAQSYGKEPTPPARRVMTPLVRFHGALVPRILFAPGLLRSGRLFSPSRWSDTLGKWVPIRRADTPDDLKWSPKPGIWT